MSTFCSYCRLVSFSLNEEIKLPCCGTTICKIHLKSSDEMFKCRSCNESINLHECLGSYEIYKLLKIYQWDTLNRDLEEKLLFINNKIKMYPAYYLKDFFNKMRSTISKKFNACPKIEVTINQFYDEEEKHCPKEVLEQLNNIDVNSILNQLKSGRDAIAGNDFYTRYLKLKQISLDLIRLCKLVKYGEEDPDAQNKTTNKNDRDEKYSIVNKETSKLHMYEISHHFFDFTIRIFFQNNKPASCPLYTCMEVSPTGLVFLGNKLGRILVFNQYTNNCVALFYNQPEKINHMVHDDEEDELICCYDDNKIRIIDLHFDHIRIRNELHDCLSYSKSVKILQTGDIVGFGPNNMIQTWDRNKLPQPKSLQVKKSQDIYDKDILLITSNRTYEWVFNNDSLLEESPLKCIELDDNDNIILSTGDNVITIIDSECNNTIMELKGHEGFITCLKMLTSNTLMSGSFDRTLKLWDLKSGLCKKTFEGHSRSIRCIESINPETVISGDFDGVIKIWDLRSGQCLRNYNHHKHPVINIRFNMGQILSADQQHVYKWVFNN